MSKRYAFYFTVLLAVSYHLLCGFDLRLSLTNESEVLNAGGIIVGGRITSEGFKVEKEGGHLVIPLPAGLDTRQGYISYRVKGIPPSYPSEWPGTCDPNQDPDCVKVPWGGHTGGLSASPDNAYAPPWTDAQHLRCDEDIPQVRRGTFKFKMAGYDDYTCEAGMLYDVCDASREYHIRLQSTYENVLIASVDGYEIGRCSYETPFQPQSGRLYVHLNHGGRGDPGSEGSNTGAVYRDLVVHFDEPSPVDAGYDTIADVPIDTSSEDIDTISDNAISDTPIVDITQDVEEKDGDTGDIYSPDSAIDEISDIGKRDISEEDTEAEAGIEDIGEDIIIVEDIIDIKDRRDVSTDKNSDKEEGGCSCTTIR